MFQNILKYAKGAGIDVAKDSSFASAIAKVPHIYLEPNQLYSLKSHVPRESLDFILHLDGIIDTKYYPIQLLEYLYSLKRGGKLIISFEGKSWDVLGPFKIMFAMLFKPYAHLIYRETQGDRYLYVFEKNAENPYKEDGINNWTFGILTIGTRNDWVEQIIESIKKQNIPNYEIIICGQYSVKRSEPFIRYIPIDEPIPRITSKKNAICKHAKYENIAVLHDRIILEDNWFEGMKKFGNMWDFVGCVVTHNGKRTNDWYTMGVPIHTMPEEGKNWGLLYYDDWDLWASINAGIFHIKKKAWERAGWSDLDYYPGNDDLLCCNDLEIRGCIPRFNPFSNAIALSYHTIAALYHKQHKKRLGRVTGPIVELIFLRLLNLWHGLRRYEIVERGVKTKIVSRIVRVILALRLKLLGHRVEDKSWNTLTGQKAI